MDDAKPASQRPAPASGGDGTPDPADGRPHAEAPQAQGALDFRTAHLWHLQPVRDILVIAIVVLTIYAGYAMRTVTVPLLVAPGGRLGRRRRRRFELQQHRIHRHPSQGRQGMGRQGEGEQGRHRRDAAMAQGCGDAQATGMAAGGEHQAIREQLATAAEAEPKATAGEGCNGLESLSFHAPHPGLAG